MAQSGIPPVPPPSANSRTSSLLLRQLDLQTPRPGNAVTVLDRLDTATAGWPVGSQSQLTNAIERVVLAEIARSTGNSKSVGKAYRRIADSAVSAARVAITLSTCFPQPPTAVAGLIRQLCDFVLAAAERSFLDRRLAAEVARVVLTELRNDNFGRAMSHELFADVVSIVLESASDSGAATFDGTALRRRYLTSDRSRRGTPAASVWRREWNLVKEIGQLRRNLAGTDDRQEPEWRAAVRAYFERTVAETPSASPSGRARRHRDVAELDAARALRDKLTRQFQQARNEGESTYGTALREAVNEHLPDWSPERWKKLLERIVKAKTKTKPSDAAARIAAAKHSLPLHHVRAGRPAKRLPRQKPRSPIVYFPDLETVQRKTQRERTGRRRHRSTPD